MDQLSLVLTIFYDHLFHDTAAIQYMWRQRNESDPTRSFSGVATNLVNRVLLGIPWVDMFAFIYRPDRIWAPIGIILGIKMMEVLQCPVQLSEGVVKNQLFVQKSSLRGYKALHTPTSPPVWWALIWEQNICICVRSHIRLSRRRRISLWSMKTMKTTDLLDVYIYFFKTIVKNNKNCNSYI